MLHSILAFFVCGICSLLYSYADDQSGLISLDQFLQTHGYHLSPQHSAKNEGYSSQAQRSAFRDDLEKLPNIGKVLEIGFNTGHSCEVFLETCKEAKVISFDINWHPYTQVGAEYMRKKYQDRFTMVIGDSHYEVPKYAHDHPGEKFDLIFIDGDHTFYSLLTDIQNCRQLANESTILWIDDMFISTVHQAVDLSVRQGIIKIIALKSADDPSGHRSWAVAKYY